MLLSTRGQLTATTHCTMYSEINTILFYNNKYVKVGLAYNITIFSHLSRDLITYVAVSYPGYVWRASYMPRESRSNDDGSRRSMVQLYWLQ